MRNALELFAFDLRFTLLSIIGNSTDRSVHSIKKKILLDTYQNASCAAVAHGDEDEETAELYNAYAHRNLDLNSKFDSVYSSIVN